MIGLNFCLANRHKEADTQRHRNSQKFTIKVLYYLRTFLALYRSKVMGFNDHFFVCRILRRIQSIRFQNIFCSEIR